MSRFGSFQFNIGIPVNGGTYIRRIGHGQTDRVDIVTGNIKIYRFLYPSGLNTDKPLCFNRSGR